MASQIDEWFNNMPKHKQDDTSLSAIAFALTVVILSIVGIAYAIPLL